MFCSRKKHMTSGPLWKTLNWLGEMHRAASTLYSLEGKRRRGTSLLKGVTTDPTNRFWDLCLELPSKQEKVWYIIIPFLLMNGRTCHEPIGFHPPLLHHHFLTFMNHHHFLYQAHWWIDIRDPCRGRTDPCWEWSHTHLRTESIDWIIYHTFPCFEGSSKQRSQNRFVGSVVPPLQTLTPQLFFRPTVSWVGAALCISSSQLTARGTDFICFHLERNMRPIFLLVLKP